MLRPNAWIIKTCADGMGYTNPVNVRRDESENGNRGGMKEGVRVRRQHRHSHNSNVHLPRPVGSKRLRPITEEKENDDVILLPGFEKVWNLVESKYFSNVREFEDGNGNKMYFWWQNGIPHASVSKPRGYANGDDIRDPAFRAGMRQDEFFGYPTGNGGQAMGHSRVCAFSAFICLIGLLYFDSRCTVIAWVQV